MYVGRLEMERPAAVSGTAIQAERPKLAGKAAHAMKSETSNTAEVPHIPDSIVAAQRTGIPGHVLPSVTVSENWS
jgi:hypothetical protein